MKAYLRVNYFWYEMGDPTWFRNFFENVAEYVDAKLDWGGRCPLLKKLFFNEAILPEQLEDLRKELALVQEVFSKMDVHEIYWSVINPDNHDELIRAECPYLDYMADDIITLADFWCTSYEAESLFEVFNRAIDDACLNKEKLFVEYINISDNEKQYAFIDIRGQSVKLKDIESIVLELDEKYSIIFRR